MERALLVPQALSLRLCLSCPIAQGSTPIQGNHESLWISAMPSPWVGTHAHSRCCTNSGKKKQGCIALFVWMV